MWIVWIVRPALTVLLLLEAAGVIFLGVVLNQMSSESGLLLSPPSADIVPVLLAGLVLAGAAAGVWLRSPARPALRFYATALVVLSVLANVMLVGFGFIGGHGHLVAAALLVLVLLFADGRIGPRVRIRQGSA